MVERLQLINDECILCGVDPFNEPDDGSPSWLVCSAAWDAGVEHLLDEHNWGFAKVIQEVEDRTDPADPNWQDAYEKPDGCLHLIKVMATDGSPITDWRVLGNKILVNDDDGILVEFIQEPDPEQWPGLFVKCLRHSVRAGIYRGIIKDPQSATAEEKKVEAYLGKARPRVDLEQPGKARFVSTLATARSRRRG